MWPVIGLLVGFYGLGPLVAWVGGMFNPTGYLGVFPWRPEVKAARIKEREMLARWGAK